MKNTSKKAALFLVTGMLSLWVLDRAIRVFLPHYDPRRQIAFQMLGAYDDAAIGPRNGSIRQRTPKGDYDLTVHFNAYGFRDEQDLALSTTNDFLAVGDSFTMGWGVESHERFSNQITDRTGLKIYNIGIPGDLAQYRGAIRYAKDCGATAGNLLVGVCMNNDLKNYESADKSQLAVYGDRKKWKARLRAELQTRSALYLACSYELQRIPALRSLFERLGISRDINELTLQNIYNENILDSSARQCVELANTAGREQARFILIPSLALWVGDNQKTEAVIHDAFASRLRAEGLHVLDLKPGFDATGRARSYYFTTDAHWNADGHALAAQHISAWLKP